MVYVETYYDYEIKKECFKVCEEKGYSKATSVLLTPTTLSTSSINNAVQTFTVEVIGDRGDSTIAFYDNGTLIPFTYNNTVYQKLDWSISDTTKTITLNLTYGVEHNITARYLGNSKCLPSTSQSILLDIPYPPAYTTQIALSPNLTGRIYRKDQNVTVNGTLKDKNNTNLASKSIKIYVDEVLVSTTTTNSSGAFSYTNSSLSNGIHTIKAVFEGTAQYFESSASVDISKGYIINLLYVDKFWVNGKGRVVAKVLDYFDNPIPSLSVSCALKSGTSISATTDTNGRAELSRTTNLTDLNSSSTVTTSYGDASNSFDIVYVAPFSFDVEGDTVTTIGNSTELTLTAQTQTNLKGMVLHLFGYNVNPPVVYLDNNNQAKFNYNGAGLGDVVINVSDTMDISQDIEITDYIQYWKAGTNNYSQMYKQIEKKFNALSNGFRFYYDKDKNWRKIIVGFGDGSLINYNVSLEFTIVDVAEKVQFIAGGWYDWDNPKTTLTILTNELRLKTNDVVLIEFVDSQTTFKVNGTTVATGEAVKNRMPCLGITNTDITDKCYIDDIKIKRLDL